MIIAAHCLPANAKAPAPVPDFVASVTSGCAPLVVSFTDKSTGNPTSWNWNFGNGQLLTGSNHTITYTEPGIYSVTLVVRNASGINSITRSGLIIVNPPPIVEFSADRTLSCVGEEVRFTDLSSNGQIDQWTWDFGDGSTSSSQNAAHVYNTAGTYPIKLTAVSADGCAAVTTKRNYVQVSAGITASFDFTIAQTCRPPFTVALQNKTEGTGDLHYSWSTGAGNSTANSPTITYNQGGDYTIRLISRDSYGCADTVSKAITLNEISTSFTHGPTCVGQTVNFENESAEEPISTIWFLGTGETIRTRDASYTYPTAGTFHVKLVNTYSTCVDSTIQTVRVSANPIPTFSVSQRQSCKVPFTANFSANTPGAAQWLWDFGDGTTATVSRPVKTYTAPGNYSLSLTVTNGDGCSISKSFPDEIQITTPTVTISNTPGQLCEGGLYAPIAQVNSIEPVAGYLWDFGDGFTSRQPRPAAHQYRSSGDYTVTLTVRTRSGCTATTTGTVLVGTRSTVDFTTTSTTVCPLVSVTFSAVSPDPALQYSWNFGNDDVRDGNEVQYNFTDTGRFTVVMTGRNNGCPASVAKEIVVSSPIAQFTPRVDCSGTHRVNFINESIEDPTGGMSYQWDFGDPSIPPSTEASPEIVFPGPGSYEVTLRAHSDRSQCGTSITREVIIPQATIEFSASKTTVCRGEIFELSANINDPGNQNRYEWQIGNEPIVMGNKMQRFSIHENGSFAVSLRVTDVNGCVRENTVQDMIHSGGPIAGFRTSAIHCSDSATIFTDTTRSALPIATYKWNFGDGNIQDFTTAPFTHHYENSGSYNVSLIVVDGAGCTDTAQNSSLIVSRPKAIFNGDTTVWCPGVLINFNDKSTGNIAAWDWDFGDGTFSRFQHPENRFGAEDRDYTVSLKVTDQSGCTDSVAIASAVKIRNPVALFELRDTAGICLPFMANFIFKGENYKSYFWDPGDGSTVSEARSYQHPYSRFGTFYPTLFVMGNGGCISTYSRSVQVSNPAATSFTYAAPETCNELTVDYSITPPPGATFILFFGDGKADSSQAGHVSHLYASPAFYQPSLLLKDSAGCDYKLNGNSPVRVIGAESLYGKDLEAFCDSATVSFTNYSIGNDPVVSYSWNFGDGNNASGANASNQYRSAGRFLPTLTTTTAHGCVDTYTDTVLVFSTPHPQIISPDTFCMNAAANFSANFIHDDSTAITYSWLFSDGLKSSDPAPARRFNAIGNYAVKLITSLPLGCADSTSKPVYVTALPPLPDLPDQATVNGQGVRLSVPYPDDIVSYKWSPAERLSCSDCPNPIATPEGNTTFKVTASDRNGCQTSAEVTVTVSCSESNFYLPNTFSPNGDGNNDWFYPRGSGLATIRMLQVFNRWGELVFERRNFAANAAASGWNGMAKGKPAVSDVYVYQIEIICENSKVIPFKGDVMLMR